MRSQDKIQEQASLPRMGNIVIGKVLDDVIYDYPEFSCPHGIYAMQA
jgi:hypothetical protein